MTKMEKLRLLLKDGVIATQGEFANMINAKDYQVRSYIHTLRSKHWAIINYPIPGSNKTKYGLAVETSHPKEGVNKTVWSLPMEKGKFVYTKV